MTSVWVILATDDASHPDGDVVIVTWVAGVYDNLHLAVEAFKHLHSHNDHGLDYRLLGPAILNLTGKWDHFGPVIQQSDHTDG